jgi:ABC-type Mn2+/Zn2+ transport system permease subunit
MKKSIAFPSRSPLLPLCLAGILVAGLVTAFAAEAQPSLADILGDVSSKPADAASTSAAPAGVVAQGQPDAGGGFCDLFIQFRWAVLGSVAAALLCSLMGTLLLARRMMLLGIALPQAASAGITLLILLVQLVHNLTLAPGQSPFVEEQTLATLAPIGSLSAVLLVLGLLAWTEHRALFPEAQWATVYIVGAALVVLFLVINPYGEAHMSTILEGNIITVTQTQFWILAGVACMVSAVMVLFRKELLLISFDPDMAWSLRFKLPLWNGLLYVLLGVTVSTSVMITGPMFAFGYLLLPPFAARPWAVGMRNFYLLSIAIGVSTSLIGCLVSFGADWPLGPSQVMVAALALAVSRGLLLFRHRIVESEKGEEPSLAEAVTGR